MDTPARQISEDTADRAQVTASNQAKNVTEVEPPYLDYMNDNAKPYVADHYRLGDNWDDPYGGFPVEISTIEGYLRGRIQNGEIANSTSAVKEELKKLEKMTNVSKEERPLIKIETLAAYVRFLQKTNDIKSNLRKYGTKY